MSDKRSAVSKVVSFDPVGGLYMKRGEKIGQGYKVVMEDGTVATYNGEKDDVVKVGEQRAYSTFTTEKGTLMIQWDAVPASTVQAKEVVKEPAKEEEKVAPGLRQPPATPPVLEKAPVIPDSQPRKGVVKLARFSGDEYKPDDSDLLYKWIITMEDGAHGAIWGPSKTEPPLTVKQEVNYVFGKVYKDGTKRIDPVPEDSVVSKETSITRMACLNTSAALMALPAKGEWTTPVATAIEWAKELETYVLGTNDQTQK